MHPMSFKIYVFVPNNSFRGIEAMWELLKLVHIICHLQGIKEVNYLLEAQQKHDGQNRATPFLIKISDL